MEKNRVNNSGFARYWRNSLTDAELSGSLPSDGEINKMITVPLLVCRSGIVDEKTVDLLFSGVGVDEKFVDAVFHPAVFKTRLVHTQKIGKNTPSVVVPIVAFVKVSRDGYLLPAGKTFIGRNVLNPLDNGVLTVGELSDLDEFLSKYSSKAVDLVLRPKEFDEDGLAIFDDRFDSAWRDFIKYCDSMFLAVASDWIGANEFIRVDYGLLKKVDDKAGMAQAIVDLYDNIVINRPELPLFSSLCADGLAPTGACYDHSDSFVSRLGHSSDVNALSNEQRDSLSHALALEHGEVLAVNGPPGTGKTTLLLSVIASLWASAALAGKSPPVIVAASSNNQAVTNIIDAFAKDYSVGSGPLAGRWLPEIWSYGAYFPSLSKEDEVKDKYQTQSFFEWIEGDDYVKSAKVFYIEKLKALFPDLSGAEVPLIKAGVDRLQAEIAAEVALLKEVDFSYWFAIGQQKALRAWCGESSQEYLSVNASALALKIVEQVSLRDQYAAHKLAHVALVYAAKNTEARVVDAQYSLNQVVRLIAENAASISSLEVGSSSLDSLKRGWYGYLVNESWWLGSFGWLPPVRHKRRQRAQLFLMGLDSDFPVTDISASLDNVGQLFLDLAAVRCNKLALLNESKRALVVDRDVADGNLRSLGSALSVLSARVEVSLLSMAELAGLVAACEVAVAKLYANATEAKRLQAAKDAAAADLFKLLEVSLAFDTSGVVNFLEIDKRADVIVRFKIFKLACHYWEGRWLLEAPRMISNKRARSGKNLNHEKELLRWRMMITPCVVATFHRLPSIMKKREREVDQFMFDFADLLIADEAGQILPQVAAASFSLAKSALVIGDVHQIAPIWDVAPSVDVGNLLGAGLLLDGVVSSHYSAFEASGQLAASGSLMLMAQAASRFHYNPALERGMYLYEHRRCRNEIVEFCNLLSYNGQLKPLRGPKPSQDIALGNNPLALPSLGYVNVDGFCECGSSGSRVNKFEAFVIAQWVADHRVALEDKYACDIAQIVAVVTPFKLQAAEIARALRVVGVQVDGSAAGLTVGTVHALQGSERPVVIFSPTYSKHSSGDFIDRDRSLLNVAVSRAKDSFLVFGDLESFGKNGLASASGLLYSLLTKCADNDLAYGVKSPRPDLVRASTKYYFLENWRGHDEFLANVLGRENGRKITIISPWFFFEKAMMFQAEFERARVFGKEVTIYTDFESNVQSSVARKFGSIFDEKVRMSEFGVNLVITDRVHSKLLFCDDDLFCNGSYNWFSATRGDNWGKFESSTVIEGNMNSENIFRTEGLLKKLRISSRGVV